MFTKFVPLAVVLLLLSVSAHARLATGNESAPAITVLPISLGTLTSSGGEFFSPTTTPTDTRPRTGVTMESGAPTHTSAGAVWSATATEISGTGAETATGGGGSGNEVPRITDVPSVTPPPAQTGRSGRVEVCGALVLAAVAVAVAGL
ncbi:hypothetical protein EDC01DRAFT_676111 [Geopyxis carbonaria]|nr:hypothetical protein EDC01DRAFT_676111 [Geopyxis carbonaria]